MAMSIPGFSAETALARSSRQYASIVRHSAMGGVQAQLYCWWDGDQLICGEPPFGGGVGWDGGVSHVCAQCRSHCWHLYPHPAQTQQRLACLDVCPCP
jgi:hypothetical protein